MDAHVAFALGEAVAMAVSMTHDEAARRLPPKMKEALDEDATFVDHLFRNVLESDAERIKRGDLTEAERTHPSGFYMDRFAAAVYAGVHAS